MKNLLFTVSLALALSREAAAADFSTVETAGKRVTICRVTVQTERLDLFHVDESGHPFKTFDRLAAWLDPRGRKLVFAMNAGMFHRDFSSVGLLVAGGKELASLNTRDGEGNFFLKPNGVFLISQVGARIVETSEYPRLKDSITLATQSGPLLVHRGKIHPAFSATSTNRLIRNGVGVPSPDVAIFAISEEPVSFHEFATLFRDTLKCPDALFLDGVISSLYSRPLKRNHSKKDLGPIIGLTE